MSVRHSIAVTVIGLLAGPIGAAPAEERPPDGSRIPVLAWIGVPAKQSTPQRYRELADCGFTINFTSFPDVDAAIRAMDVAQAAGVQVLVSCPQLSADPKGTVRRLKDHPGLAGYFLRDEPSAADFPGLKAWADKIRAADPHHLIYVNLLPNYATAEQLGVPTYAEYLDGFTASVPTSMLSFDYYPIVGRSVRASWYENLELISAAATKAHEPVWAFALSLRHYDYPTATLPDLREQVYSDLAYGAQAIQYFTYWKPDGLESSDAPIDAQGQRTIVYERVRQMNEEIRAHSGVFLGARVMSLGHTGEHLPAGTHAYNPAPPVRDLHTDGTGAIVSTLRKGRRQSLVLVNRDVEHPMNADVRFEDGTRIEQVSREGVAQPLNGPTYRGEVAAGDVLIFGWDAAQ